MPTTPIMPTMLSASPAPDALETIDPAQLTQVAGGASSNDQLTAMLTQITSSIKDLASSKGSQSDPMQMMMMMMMMGGFGGGGGGGGYVAAGPAAGPPVINVDTSVLGGGRGGLGGGCFVGARCGKRGSKKGW
jgi:hypothetical protein